MTKKSLVVMFIASCFCNAAIAASPVKHKNVAKMKGTPDLLQTLGVANFPGGGKQFCAPAAVSNSLMWLGNHGYPKLLPQVNGTASDTQIELVHLLASPKIMNTGPKTGPKSGTSAGGLMKGIRRYVEDCGYTCKKLECQGWRNVPEKYSPETEIPDLNWIKSALANDHTAIWWNVGWYQAGKQPGEYKRIGGHWLTVVGYRNNRGKHGKPDVFILHDPAPRAGKSFARENVLLEKIEAGTLEGGNKGLPRNAAGFYKVGGGMHVKKIADYGILDCVVVLELASE